MRNEAWVLPHSLASLSGFCDIIIVSDQNSDDESREICRRFPKVLLIESTECRISTQVRWQLFDAARSYDGCNLMWCTDADELVAPAASREFFTARRDDLKPGTIVECMFIHPWHSPTRYREYHWGYAPHFKALAFVDDRRMDYDRSRPNSIHEPRVPIEARGASCARASCTCCTCSGCSPAARRCGRHGTGAASCSTASRRGRSTSTTPRPCPTPACTLLQCRPLGRRADLSRPGDRSRAVVERARHPRVVREHGPAFFERLEIWHIPVLRQAFVRRVGRRPRPDVVPPAVAGARGPFGRRLAAAVRRRL